MSFRFISSQRIKSGSLRALASHWDRLAAGRSFPPFVEFTPEPSMHEPRQLVVWNIEGEDRQRKFRALYQGENVAEVFNSAWAGKTMDQVVPMSLRRVTLEAAEECVTSGCLVYSIISTIDTNEQRVDCERLLLPFGRGSKVEQILASLQLISVRGGVRRRKILDNFEMQADVLLSGKIKSGFTKTASASASHTIGVRTAAGGHSNTEKPLRASKTSPSLAETIGTTAAEKRRGAQRRRVLRAGRISFATETMTCTVRNISATGASLEGTNLDGIPDTFKLVMEMETAERSCSVVWRKDNQIGVRFSRTL
jgi:hypothetical protein